MKDLLNRYVLRSRVYAMLVASVLLAVPFTTMLSGALAGLVTLRYGVPDGAMVLGGSVLLAGAVAYLSGNGVAQVVEFLLAMGLPVLGLAWVLRRSNSQGLTLLAAATLAVVVAALVHLASEDPVVFWRGVLDTVVQLRADANLPPDVAQRIARVLDGLAPWMVYFPVMAAVSSMLVLLLARYWHALVDNPGGFRREFRALRVDRRLAVAALLVTALAIADTEWAGGLPRVMFQMVVAVYTFQGVAVIHAVVAYRKASAAWLVALYLGLVFMWPIVGLATAVTGFTDTWLDYRARWEART